MSNKKKNVYSVPSNYQRTPSFINQEGKEVVRGDMIKIQGEHGIKFRFFDHVVNTISGAEWIDCFEVYNGQTGIWRSFYKERIRLIPKKRKRSKAV